MRSFVRFILLGTIPMIAISSCNEGTKKRPLMEADNDILYPIGKESAPMDEVHYTEDETIFHLWSPPADDVVVRIYEKGLDGEAIDSLHLTKDASSGSWNGKIEKDLKNCFYTFSVHIGGKWLPENQGIFATAVGVNGYRGAIIDYDETNPGGWEKDIRPPFNNLSEAVVYELHHRDFSISESSGIQNKGKYLALTEEGTKTPQGLASGIDHLKELGITHVQIMPSFDFKTIDETRLDLPQYNWGYDPFNFTVPEGSYSTDPYNPITRIKEFKQMVMALHKAGIRVIMDVSYNHTYDKNCSSFDYTVPRYFYRHHSNGEKGDGSYCGNETASERPMMRKLMIESLKYWVNEYHIDGFRFDLMQLHDIETMNKIRKALSQIDSTIILYGEGWLPEADAILKADKAAQKYNLSQMPGIGAYSDEIRDGIKGNYGGDHKGGFAMGLHNFSETIKFGIAGAVNHPQIDNSKVKDQAQPWATTPQQMLSYVTCHDNACLYDRIKTAKHSASFDEIIRINKLAQSIVLTSQGIPFLYGGEELLRTKRGANNSYNAPDSINLIDWNNKSKSDLTLYYSQLIALRKHHPSFHMCKASEVVKHLEFIPSPNNEDRVVAFVLKDHAAGDSWKDIIVVHNALTKPAEITLPSQLKNSAYQVVCSDGIINENGLGSVAGPVITVPAQSTFIMHSL